MSASRTPVTSVAGASDSFARLGRFVVRRRWWVVAAWAVLLAVALPLAPRVVGEFW
jgi:hypothetical protein